MNARAGISACWLVDRPPRAPSRARPARDAPAGASCRRRSASSRPRARAPRCRRPPGTSGRAPPARPPRRGRERLSGAIPGGDVEVVGGLVSSSTSAPIASARANEARVSSPPENVSSARPRSARESPVRGRSRWRGCATGTPPRVSNRAWAARSGLGGLVAAPSRHLRLQRRQLRLDLQLLRAPR